MIGHRIRAARKQVGKTQDELANMIGVKRSVISKYENGQIEPSISQLKKIAYSLGIPWYELYSDDPQEQGQIVRNQIIDSLNNPKPASDDYKAGYKAGHAIGHSDCLKELMTAPTDPNKLRSITNNLLSLGYSLKEVKLMGARLSLPKEDLEAFILILERNRSKGG